jgi:transposase
MSKTYQAAPEQELIAKRNPTLYIAFELSQKKWKLGLGDGKGNRARIVTIVAQDWEALGRELDRARERFGLEKAIRIVSCYEIGREGFWLHRALVSRGIENVVVDAASIEVNRRDRRAKTDRMDAEKLLRQLVRYGGGEKRVWSVVRVPDEQAEDERQLHREIEILKRERTQHRVRIQSLLFTQGIDVTVGCRFLKQLDKFRRWNGEPVAVQLKERLRREYQRLQAVQADLRQLERQQTEKLKTERTAGIEKIRRLQQLRGIGMASSWMFVMELLGWRQFRNRREVGAAVGLTPTPYQSGESDREQGISHSGNRRVRAMAIEIAWAWLRLQPQSELSRWYRRRFGSGGARMRKIGIVAMARRLVVDLWRYLEQGIVPAGARLKPC